MGGLVARNFILKTSRARVITRSPVYLHSNALGWSCGGKIRCGTSSQSSLFLDRHGARKPLLDESFLYVGKPQVSRRTLPQEIAKHLFFTFIDNKAGDGTVSLSSELRPEAQEEATRLYGYEKSHMDILTTPEMLKTVNGLLESVR